MSEAYGTLTIGESAAWLQLTPLAQYLLAVPLLGEPVTLPGLAGIVIGVGGIAWATVYGHVAQRAAGGTST
jgi:drug/metabolite transporter (DMT)-like permease